MVHSPRFDAAIDKLYNAFQEGTLIPECCNHCAVGTICGNTDVWKHLSDFHGSTQLNYVGMVNETFGKKFSGYRPSELLQIEMAFLKGCGYSLPLSRTSKKPLDPTSKDILFEGLCSVFSLLCKLDELPDIMDFEKLLDFRPHSQNMALV